MKIFPFCFRIGLALLGIAVLEFTPRASAQVQISSMPNQKGSILIFPSMHQPGGYGQNFTVAGGDFALSEIDAFMFASGSLSGFHANLYLADGSGIPTGDAITSLSFPSVSTPGAYTFIPETPIVLQNGATYTFAIQRYSGVTGTITWVRTWPYTPDGGSFGWTMGPWLFAPSLGNDGSLGSNGGTEFFKMSVTASAVPEPSTYASILGLAVIGLAATRRRRVHRVA
mgnify:CR=1 FL=1